MEVKSELRYKNHVRMTLWSHARFALRNYAVEPYKWEKKIRNNYAMAYEIVTAL